MYKVLGLFRVQKVVKSIAVLSLSCVNFEVFLTYMNEEKFHILPVVEGSMITVVAFFASIWLILYNSTFASWRTRRFTFIAIVMRFLGGVTLAY